MAEEKYFDLKIISPNRIFYQGKASMVELNTLEGRIGIYRRHLPVTTVLEPGIAVITEEGGTSGRMKSTGTGQKRPESVQSADFRQRIRTSTERGQRLPCERP